MNILDVRRKGGRQKTLVEISGGNDYVEKKKKVEV